MMIFVLLMTLRRWNSIECIIRLIIMIQLLRFIINGEKSQIKLYIKIEIVYFIRMIIILKIIK